MKRTFPNEKLGLTLCDGLPVNRTNSNSQTTADETGGKVEEDKRLELSCKSTVEETKKVVDTEDEFNEVFIQTIAIDSLAAADGRLFQGDILLQVTSIQQ